MPDATHATAPSRAPLPPESGAPLLAGIDACKGGWVVALAPGWPLAAPPRILLLPDFAAVLRAVAHCPCAGLDMPVGLPSGAGVRRCDLLAREELLRLAGPAETAARGTGSRVFLAPPRETLAAATPGRFQALHRAARGVGAGLPVWGIVPRLREVDAAMTPALQERVVETYPELTLARLAGRTLPSKHGAPGLEARRKLLCGADCAWADKGVRCGTVAAAPHDLLDAVACLAAACARRQGRALRLPGQAPPHDARGLRMEIWF